MTYMTHKHCGGVIAQSVNPDFEAIPGMTIRGQDFYLAGTKTHPQPGSPITCPKCHKQVATREIFFSGDDTEPSDCLDA